MLFSNSWLENRGFVGLKWASQRHSVVVVYLYRAVDSSGATIDFPLSAKRDAAAAERFLTKSLGGENHPAPRVINKGPE
jgi:transposase-like protein